MTKLGGGSNCGVSVKKHKENNAKIRFFIGEPINDFAPQKVKD